MITKKEIRQKLRYFYKEVKTDDYSHEIEEFQKELDKDVEELDSDIKAILKQPEALYNFIRTEKPDVIVETGVCHGYSTAIILKALKENEKGKLYSIDYPSTNVDEENLNLTEEKTGILVPDELKENWELIIGDSTYRLPELLEELGEIDTFLHDSLHTYNHMMFELTVAWKHLKENGYLICDDSAWNDAFHDFVRSNNVPKQRIGYVSTTRNSHKNL